MLDKDLRWQTFVIYYISNMTDNQTRKISANLHLSSKVWRRRMKFVFFRLEKKSAKFRRFLHNR